MHYLDRAWYARLAFWVTIAAAGFGFWLVLNLPAPSPPLALGSFDSANAKSQQPHNGDQTQTPLARQSVPFSTSPTATSEDRTGTLEVEVYCAPQLPVEGVSVLIGQSITGITDARGRLSAVLPPGTYSVSVDADSLPRPLMPPYEQSFTEVTHAVPDGFFGRKAQVVAGEFSSVRIRLFHPATVTGLVLDATGKGLPGYMVRAQARKAGMSRVASDALTIHDGSFEIASFYPGIYTFSIHFVGGGAMPIPQRVDVPEGCRIALPPLVVGAGRCTIQGRLVDQAGVGFGNVEVIAYPVSDFPPDETPLNLADEVGTAVTRPDGTYELRNLPAHKLMVQVHPYGSLKPLGSTDRIRQPVDPVLVDTRSHSLIDVGTSVAIRSQAFTLRAKVVLNEARVRAADSMLKKIAPSEVFVAPAADLADESRWIKLRLVEGRYEYASDLPIQRIVLIVRRRGFAPAYEQFEVIPGTVRDVEISYP